MEFESTVSSLKNHQDMLDRLFSITPETRHRLDAGDVPEGELRLVYTRSCKEDPWAFMYLPKGFWLPGVGLALLNLGLGLGLLLVVLGYGTRLSATNAPLAVTMLVTGIVGCVIFLHLALKGIKEQVQSLLKKRRAILAAAIPSLQVIDAEVSTFRYWDSGIGWEFGLTLLMSELVLHSIEKACPGEAQAVRDGRVGLPGFLKPFIIVGRVRIYLIAGARHSSPQSGRIVGITLFEGASVTEKKPRDQPQSHNADLNHKICAD